MVWIIRRLECSGDEPRVLALKILCPKKVQSRWYRRITAGVVEVFVGMACGLVCVWKDSVSKGAKIAKLHGALVYRCH